MSDITREQMIEWCNKASASKVSFVAECGSGFDADDRGVLDELTADATMLRAISAALFAAPHAEPCLAGEPRTLPKPTEAKP